MEEDKMMKQRVYGVMGISSIMANWNADFSGYPKTTSKGEIFGSDKAFKYPMKKMWDESGEKVLYIKSMTTVTDKKNTVNVVPKTLLQRYGQLFDSEDVTDAEKVLTNLFSAIDVKNFGATFAEKGCNIAITGAVQFGQGFNKYADSAPQEQQILSPFRDAKASQKTKDGEEAKNSTLGTKIVSDEAHYFYPFSINPKMYNEYIKLGVTQGYTQEDYQKFKETVLCAATSFATNAKAGCENEFGLFIETQEDVYLPNLDTYIQFEHSDKEKNIIRVNCGNLLQAFATRINAVEIYYNPFTTKLETDISDVKMYHIFTRKEL